MTIYRLAVLTAAAFATVANAQDSDPISAERPSFSSSPIALGEGLWQVEAGYQYTSDGGSVDTDVHTLPLFLLRGGLAENVELQVSWPGYSWAEVNGSNFDGTTDMTAGVKWQLTDRNAATPVAVFLGASLPVGSDEFSADDSEPILGLFWSHAGRLSLFGTAILTESGKDTVIGNAIGINLPPRGNVGSYVEYAGTYQDGEGPQHILNGGLSFLRHNDLVFDVSLGIGLNDRAPDIFLGFGLATRF